MFIVVELQKVGDQVANIVTKYDSLNAAKSKYHTILAAAAISAVEVHSAVLLNVYGDVIEHQHFIHEVETE